MFTLNTRTIIAVLLAVIFINSDLYAQDKVKGAIVSFYNLENLFDTIDDPHTNDAEFLPNGANRWTGTRYMEKLSNMATVVSQIGSDVIKGGPTILGVSEIENRSVLEDLINTPQLVNSGYAIVHYDSPDRRGVDVGLLYRKGAFEVVNSTSNRLTMPGRKDWYSRDQLVVSGKLDGEMIHIIVNHWPSRGAGPEYRAAAGKLSKQLSDSLKAIYPNAKIFVMGDLNDDPTDPSVMNHLGAKGKIKDARKSGLYNPYYRLFQDGIGSLAYRDAWNLFDQIVISPSLVDEDNPNQWSFHSARIFNEQFLIQKEGQFKGYPFRTFAGGAYLGGYSDHFPVYVI